MSWLDFVVLTLAASAVVDVWFNGSLFADWRAFLECSPTVVPTQPLETPPMAEPGFFAVSPDYVAHAGVEVRKESNKLPFLMRLADRYLPAFVAELLGCAFCFSYHAPWMVALVFFFPATLVTIPWVAFLLKLPAYSLAATRLGNLINAWAPPAAKYRHDD